jgi:hypothetical protein
MRTAALRVLLLALAGPVGHARARATPADPGSDPRLLGLHVAEVWLFGFGYLLLVNGSLSELRGTSGGLLDFVYFSAVVYTTLGLGDIIPSGAIRFMTGTEALTGFVLITWSASFTFLEMQKFWKN